MILVLAQWLIAIPAVEPESANEMARLWFDFWKFTGSAAATLAVVLLVVLVHYWKIILPREQAKTEDQRGESRARAAALLKTAETSERLVATSERLVDQQAQIVASQTRLGAIVEGMEKRFDNFGDQLSDVWRHIRGDSDPNRSVIDD